MDDTPEILASMPDEFFDAIPDDIKARDFEADEGAAMLSRPDRFEME